MHSLRVFNRQTGILAVAAALLLTVILPVIASAAQLTERSIQLSSSSVNADDVTYNVNFTSVGAAGAVVIDFCGNTPLIGEACSTATDFSASAAGLVAGSDFTAISALDANTVRLTGPITAATDAEVSIEGIHNPSVAGPLYARIVTYDNAANADTYVSTETSAEDTDRVDEGGAAMLINNSIGVSGAVLESLQFCVSGADTILENCAGATPPTLKLGQQIGTEYALASGVVNSGSIFTQISTNAANGAVVSLKSSTTGCGGLMRFGTNPATQCDIAPAGPAGNVTNADATAKFGVKVGTATDPAGSVSSNGAYQAAASSAYDTTNYRLNWVIGDQTGVTSTFGDRFLDTNNAPVNNKNLEITFGASVTNATPAGLYSADMSLIATGKF